MNRLFYGDNLGVMNKLLPNASVDLIYLDPPFKSNRNYNLMYSRIVQRPIPEQEEAFCDTWEMDPAKEEMARAMPALMREQGIEDYYVEFWRLWMNALRHTNEKLLAYLIYMVQRLMFMKLILKPTGSIYLHCDPEASHYIKVMMDAIFHHSNFQNEIIWKRTSAHSDAHKLGAVHDVILHYTKTDKFTRNRVYVPYSPEYIEKRYRHRDERGRYMDAPLTAKGLTGGGYRYEYRGKVDDWRVPLSTMQELDSEDELHITRTGGLRRKKYLKDMKGVAVNDVWTDIPPLNSQDKMRMGYPTQKPPNLLKRIITLSTNEGDVVFDPFCGCGTAAYAAQDTGREWIGCDIAILAVRLVEDHLKLWYDLERGADYETTGIPNSVESAQRLFQEDPFQFEHWIVERVGAFPTKKTGDKGVDGVLYFDMDGGDLGKMVLSVKGGNIRPSDIRDLQGVLHTDPDAHLAGFLSLREPTRAMREAASSDGQWSYKGETYDAIQLLTVQDVVEGKRLFQTPTRLKYKDDHLQETLRF